MHTIKRNKDVILDNEDLTHLYTFKNFPAFMGCTDEPASTDLKSDMSWHISENSGMIQLNPLLPLDIIYASGHGSGTTGKSWQEHHEAFAHFINKFDVNNILEIGGLHGILCEKFNKINHSSDWTIIEPNPITKKNIKAKVIKGWFDDKFQSDCKYDAIVHSHVLEHTYDPNNFIKNISSFLNDGLLMFSVPNMDEMINRGYTGYLHFEHTFLLGEPHIEYLLFKNSFEIVRKEYYRDDHSIFYCAKKTKNNITKKCFKDIKDNYQTLFNNYISSQIKDVIEINKKIKDTTLPVFLFGAHVFSQYLISFGLNTDKIVCLLDNDPLKENKRLYGTDLKSFSPKKLKGIGEAIVILRAGAYNNEIKEDISNNINKNIKFI
jgi:hypothetical protein